MTTPALVDPRRLQRGDLVFFLPTDGDAVLSRAGAAAQLRAVDCPFGVGAALMQDALLGSVWNPVYHVGIVTDGAGQDGPRIAHFPYHTAGVFHDSFRVADPLTLARGEGVTALRADRSEDGEALAAFAEAQSARTYSHEGFLTYSMQVQKEMLRRADPGDVFAVGLDVVSKGMAVLAGADGGTCSTPTVDALAAVMAIEVASQWDGGTGGVSPFAALLGVPLYGFLPDDGSVTALPMPENPPHLTQFRQLFDSLRGHAQQMPSRQRCEAASGDFASDDGASARLARWRVSPGMVHAAAVDSARFTALD